MYLYFNENPQNWIEIYIGYEYILLNTMVKLPYVIIFIFEFVDDENKYYLEELNNYLNNPIMKMVIQLEKNNDCIIKPFDK